MLDPKRVSVGDIVFLNSGSPELTVDEITDSGLIGVTFFETSKHGQADRSLKLPAACFALTNLWDRQRAGFEGDESVHLQ